MKKRLLHAFFLLSFSLSAQKTIIYGTVTDSKNEPVSFAQVVICEDAEGKKYTSDGVRADLNGKFILKTKRYGMYFILTKHVGKIQKIKKIELKNDSIKLDFQLENLEANYCNLNILRSNKIDKKKSKNTKAIGPPLNIAIEKIKNQHLYLKANDKISKIELYNLDGNIIKSKSLSDTSFEAPHISIENIVDSLILIKVYDFNGKIGTGKIAIH